MSLEQLENISLSSLSRHIVYYLNIPGGASGFASFALVSGWRDLVGSFALHFSGGGASLDRRSGLLVREINFSLVVIVTRSVLRSSVLLLAGRGLPDAVRL